MLELIYQALRLLSSVGFDRLISKGICDAGVLLLNAVRWPVGNSPVPS